LKLPAPKARYLPHLADAHAYNPGDPKQGLRHLLDISETVAQHVIDNAHLLGMLDGSGSLAELASELRIASVVERRELVRHYVERFPPYADWKRRIALGFEPLDAARYMRRLHDIEDSASDVRDWCLDIGLYCGSIKEEAAVVTPVETAPPSLGGFLSDVLNRAEGVDRALSGYVGSATWDRLGEPVRQHLNASLAKIANNENPDESVREAGLALDKYMSDYGNAAAGTGYAGLAMGVAAKKLLDDGVILRKQAGFTAYGVDLRNAAEHADTDADLPTTSRWSILPNSSVTYLRVVLDFIRSTSAKTDGRYEL
jgi:hypothetical protein